MEEMSDTMLLGVLRMPEELSQSNEIGRKQLHDRCLEAADRIQDDADKIARMEREMECRGRVMDSMENQITHLEEANAKLLKVNTTLIKVNKLLEDQAIDSHAVIQKLREDLFRQEEITE
jgi:hypothetical protein